MSEQKIVKIFDISERFRNPKTENPSISIPIKANRTILWPKKKSSKILKNGKVLNFCGVKEIQWEIRKILEKD